MKALSTRTILINLCLSLLLTLAALTLVSHEQTSLIPSFLLFIISSALILSINYLFIYRPLILQERTIRAHLLEEHSDEPLQQACLSHKQQLTQAGQAIETQASELAINSAQVSHFLEQLAGAITHSGDNVDNLAAAAEQVSINSKAINDNAAIASSHADQTNLACAKSMEVVDTNLTQINQLQDRIQGVSSRINALSDNAQEVQKITNFIDSISEQTNLLALNAAIEAARAGEHGRGFAVVADEVRALASKTSQATEQIGDMLNQMNNETAQTATIMSSTVTQASQTVQSMASLQTSLNQINQLSENTSSASSQISLALQEQELSSHEIAKSISQLHDVLVKITADTRKVSSQADVLSQSTESIFVQLAHFNTHSLIETMCEQAHLTAQKVGALFSEKVSNNTISLKDMFDSNYQAIANTNPTKYSTCFDQLTDQLLPAIQEPLLAKFKDMIYAGAVDLNGYFPTHNKKFSQPLSGDYQKDMLNNRTKRLFNDATGIRCCQHTNRFLLQTYKRDTGEIMHDVSAPIYVDGKHWGAFRIGFKAQP